MQLVVLLILHVIRHPTRQAARHTTSGFSLKIAGRRREPLILHNLDYADSLLFTECNPTLLFKVGEETGD